MTFPSIPSCSSGSLSAISGLGGLKETKMFLPHPRVKVSIVGSLRDREVAYSASDPQGSNFKSCVWRTVSSQSSHHPQEVLMAQFSLFVHKGGLKPDSFHFFCSCRGLIMRYLSLSFYPIDYKPLHNDPYVLGRCAITFRSHKSCSSGFI